MVAKFVYHWCGAKGQKKSNYPKFKNGDGHNVGNNGIGKFNKRKKFDKNTVFMCNMC